jgi:hypothetical protein
MHLHTLIKKNGEKANELDSFFLGAIELNSLYIKVALDHNS